MLPVHLVLTVLFIATIGSFLIGVDIGQRWNRKRLRNVIFMDPGVRLWLVGAVFLALGLITVGVAWKYPPVDVHEKFRNTGNLGSRTVGERTWHGLESL